MRAAFGCLLALILLSPDPGCSESSKTKLRGDRFDPVRVLIGQKIRQDKMASVSIAAAQDGKVVWEESFGWADKEKQIAATPHSMYALASITKSLTATGLMVLVERGLVDLDKPVNDYLPGAKLVSFVGDAKEATLRRVLQHTAGLPVHGNIFPISPGAPKPPDQDESIRRYGIIVEEPGREYQYSNFGYGVIDRVIAAVSGKSYTEFMKTEVFAPLGMTHTSVMIDPPLDEFAVQDYDAQGKPVSRLDFDHRGASAVYASVHDLVRYGMFHLKNHLSDQKQIIGDETIDLTHEPSDLRVPDEEPAEVHAGLGWAVIDLAGYRFLGASGGMPGTVTRLALIPDKNVAVAIVINSDVSEVYTPWEIEWETFAALLPGFPERPEIPKTKNDRSPFPPELQGEWTGTIKTYEAALTARLSIADGSTISLDINGRTTQPIPVENPLGLVGFKDGILKGPFFGAIPTDDARRSPHVVFLRLRLRNETLYGYVAAVAMDRTFILPNWMKLRKVTE
jgi:CubicO group peptidase (beta-lactamase class C family)